MGIVQSTRYELYGLTDAQRQKIKTVVDECVKSDDPWDCLRKNLEMEGPELLFLMCRGSDEFATTYCDPADDSAQLWSSAAKFFGPVPTVMPDTDKVAFWKEYIALKYVERALGDQPVAIPETMYTSLLYMLRDGYKTRAVEIGTFVVGRPTYKYGRWVFERAIFDVSKKTDLLDEFLEEIFQRLRYQRFPAGTTLRDETLEFIVRFSELFIETRPNDPRPFMIALRLITYDNGMPYMLKLLDSRSISEENAAAIRIAFAHRKDDFFYFPVNLNQAKFDQIRATRAYQLLPRSAQQSYAIKAAPNRDVRFEF